MITLITDFIRVSGTIISVHAMSIKSAITETILFYALFIVFNLFLKKY